MDRFSNLPDELIRHIGSFLSAKEAAFTNILSKRLLNLITIESRLAFGDPDHESFKIFADGLLRVRDATDRVRRFSLRLRPAHFDPSQYNLVNDCLRNVLKRGVMELELDINANGDYSLPIEVFTCSSVVKMKLGSGFMIDFIPDDAWLQALKALLLGSIRFNGLPDDCVFQRLITVSPQLEALVIVGFNCELWNWSQTVSSEALKRLVIRRQDRVEQDGSSSAPISFNTPNLKIFEYYDLLRDEYPVVNLNSLDTAILDLPVSHAPESYNATNLIQGLKTVENMRLDHVETMQLFDAMETAVPVFGKLRRLFTSTKQDHCCYGLRLLVENSPFLKSLEIEELHYQLKEGKNWREVCVWLSGYSFLKACPIESLRITAFYGREGEMVQMQLILQNLMCLELLELHVLEIMSLEEQKEIMSELSMIPRGSPKCKVKVIFS